MTSIKEDEDQLNKEAALRAEEEKSGEGKAGKSGGTGSAGGMAFSVAENEEDVRRTKTDDSGEGDQDSFGRGKAGAGAGIRLSAQQTKEVGSVWRHLDVSAVVEAVAEFFSDLPMRASANLSVTWQRTQANAKSFAIVNWIIEAGHAAVRELARTRERSRVRGAGRDSRGLNMNRPRGVSMTMKPGPTAPT